jgi:predicted phage baseplate assembly protein
MEAAQPAAFDAPREHSVSTLMIEVEGFDRPWQPRPTLLDSPPDEQVFRVEVDDQGDATVVFGDNIFGRQPDETARITATYRVGGGTVGNVAADTLILPRPRPDERTPWLTSVTNPLPARGGRDRETSDHARRFGPATFKQPLVAVTAGDYQTFAQSFVDPQGQPLLQRASAAFRWTGSWPTAVLAVDPRGEERLEGGLRSDLLAFLEGRRLAGYDLDVIRALYVPVELAIEFCLARGFRAGDVQQQLQQVLGSGDLPGGRRGFFHPDNFSFGDNLYVSQLYATIMTVAGVESAQITRLAKLRAARPDAETSANLRQGYLRAGADQIIRLDNDRNFPENGTLAIRPKGTGV